MNTDYFIRKMGHVTVYFILTLLVIRGLKTEGVKINFKLYLTAIIISFLYAMTDEYHQSLTGFRDGRWTDVGIDSIGILSAIFASIYLPTSLHVYNESDQN